MRILLGLGPIVSAALFVVVIKGSSRFPRSKAGWAIDVLLVLFVLASLLLSATIWRIIDFG